MTSSYGREVFAGAAFRWGTIMAAMLVLGSFGVANGGEPKEAAGWSQWCGRQDRNPVSEARGLVDGFEEISAAHPDGKPLRNVRWVRPADGLETGRKTMVVSTQPSATVRVNVYGSPVVADGRVYLGSMSGGYGGRGILCCWRECDGELLWWLSVPRSGVQVHGYGITSTPTVQGDRVYVLAPNGHVLCLNANGMKDGNKGPFQDEAYYFQSETVLSAEPAPGPDGKRVIVSKRAEKPANIGPKDADILWKFDMVRQANAWLYNATTGSPLLRGNRLYVPTGTVCTPPIRKWINEHKAQYWSPSLIVLDAQTGELLAAEDTFDFTKIGHGAHSSSALGVVNGKELLIQAVMGRCCAFDPDFSPRTDGKPATLRLVWDCDYLARESYPSNAPRKGPGRPIGRAETLATPVIYKNRVYVSAGNDLIASGSKAGGGRLVCIDATRTGNITKDGLVWSFDEIRSSASTVAIHEGVLYTADAAGTVYCLDADTGKLYWKHEASHPIWSSPVVADGKVYVPTYGAGLLIFATGKEKRLLFEDKRSNSRCASVPAVANGTVFLVAHGYLYALGK